MRTGPRRNYLLLTNAEIHIRRRARAYESTLELRPVLDMGTFLEAFENEETEKRACDHAPGET